MMPSTLKRFGVGLATLVMVLLFWVRVTVQSTQMSYAIREVEDSIRNEQRRRSDLELQKDQYVSLDSIEKNAISKLGLIAPESDNIIIIPVARS